MHMLEYGIKSSSRTLGEAKRGLEDDLDQSEAT